MLSAENVPKNTKAAIAILGAKTSVMIDTRRRYSSVSDIFGGRWLEFSISLAVRSAWIADEAEEIEPTLMAIGALNSTNGDATSGSSSGFNAGAGEASALDTDIDPEEMATEIEEFAMEDAAASMLVIF